MCDDEKVENKNILSSTNLLKVRYVNDKERVCRRKDKKMEYVNRPEWKH